MQRNFDLVVSLLGAMRDAPAAQLTVAELVQALQAPGIDEADEASVQHHLAIMEDAGFVKRVDEVIATRWRLTWAGYDALEGNEDDEDEDDEVDPS
ncbi:DUF2513 domain-containing protein [Orrella sp. JC864]|uniref:DUF2513 domain-containing protein n=1 Tax=Orrella sp. JC864 TaxID=3120298 RepID=UPI0012BB7A57